MISASEISNSLHRLQAAFEGRYGNYPLLEGKKPVGMLTLDKEKRIVYITYRGSVSSFLELLSCLCFWKKKWPEPKEGSYFKGKAHAALINSFQKIKKGLNQHLESLSQNPDISLKGWKFVVEGYSRGSALAMLTSLFLKQSSSNNSVHVFTYSTMRVFDKEGAMSYEKILGKQHLSFLCEEDPFPRYLGPSAFGFHLAPKNQVIFKAAGTPEYDERVRRKNYSYLHPWARRFSRFPVLGWIFQKIISPESWEAHMPQTYNVIVSSLC
ncbi:hypothetical protein PHSC3_001720 [Chlamydiales bacterium STE3]|nr:hypothetical protein PHSC3_001720 [Chlamydiales bacterium STE3]